MANKKVLCSQILGQGGTNGLAYFGWLSVTKEPVLLDLNQRPVAKVFQVHAGVTFVVVILKQSV
jgi:hypothetical protein